MEKFQVLKCGYCHFVSAELIDTINHEKKCKENPLNKRCNACANSIGDHKCAIGNNTKNALDSECPDFFPEVAIFHHLDVYLYLLGACDAFISVVKAGGSKKYMLGFNNEEGLLCMFDFSSQDRPLISALLSHPNIEMTNNTIKWKSQ